MNMLHIYLKMSCATSRNNLEAKPQIYYKITTKFANAKSKVILQSIVNSIKFMLTEILQDESKVARVRPFSTLLHPTKVYA